MACASASDREYVEFVIEYHGWKEYFSRIVCVGYDGGDKVEIKQNLSLCDKKVNDLKEVLSLL